MAALDAVGALLLVVCLVLVAFVVRRWLLVRGGGTVEMSWRLRHWTYGLARYEADRLLWYATFSLRLRPTRTLPREGLHIDARRDPHGHEAWTLVPGAVVLRCSGPAGATEVGLPVPAMLGFLAWVEAGPRRALRLPQQPGSISADSPTVSR